MVNASPGNGLEVWRRLKTHYNPATAITELGYTARLIQPCKVKENCHLQSAAEKWEEAFRRQESTARAIPLSRARPKRPSRRRWRPMRWRPTSRLIRAVLEIKTKRGGNLPTHSQPHMIPSARTPAMWKSGTTTTTTSPADERRAMARKAIEKERARERRQDSARSLGRVVGAKLSDPATACPKKHGWLNKNGKGNSRNQVHEVAPEEGDSDMGANDLCPTGASTDELYDWPVNAPWQHALATHRMEEPSDKERGQPTAPESVRDFLKPSSIKSPHEWSNNETVPPTRHPTGGPPQVRRRLSRTSWGTCGAS